MLRSLSLAKRSNARRGPRTVAASSSASAVEVANNSSCLCSSSLASFHQNAVGHRGPLSTALNREDNTPNTSFFQQQRRGFSSLLSSTNTSSPPHFSSSSSLSTTTTTTNIRHQIHHHYNHSNNYQHQQIRTKVFVSSHNDMNITSNQILEYCANRGIYVDKARVTSSHVVLQECPFCSKPSYGKADNLYKCYVSIGGGAYFCHRCGSGGSWFDFKAHLRGYQHHVMSVGGGGNNSNAVGNTNGASPTTNRSTAANRQTVQQPANPIPKGATQPLPLPKQRLQAAYNSSLMDAKDNESNSNTATTNNNSNSNSNNNVMDYLQNTRGLKPATLRKYGVGRATYHFPSDQNGQYVAAECVTFPWIISVKDLKEQEALRGAEYKTDKQDDTGFVTRRIKVRALEHKSWQRLDPAGGGWGLFGFHTVPADATEVILTEGEYDAMVSEDVPRE